MLPVEFVALMGEMWKELKVSLKIRGIFVQNISGSFRDEEVLLELIWGITFIPISALAVHFTPFPLVVHVIFTELENSGLSSYILVALFVGL